MSQQENSRLAFFSLMITCDGLLSFEVNQALACAKGLSPSYTKGLLLQFGLVHLFVVSGFHVYAFFLFLKEGLHLKSLYALFIIFVFTSLCEFSTPLSRAFLHKSLQEIFKHRSLHVPTGPTLLLSSLLCLPLSLITGQLFSLALSTSFCFFFLSSFKTKSPYLNLFLFALPVFNSLFGIPQISHIILAPLFAFLIGFIMMPLALTSLFFKDLELINLHLWWNLEDFLNFLSIFWNMETYKETSLNFEGLPFFFFYSLAYITVFLFLDTKWQRESYSF